MAKIQVNTVIQRPIQEVFATLSDQTSRPKWSATTLHVEKTSAGPIRRGTTWRYVDRVFGRRLEREAVVTEYELHRKWTEESTTGPVPFKVQWDFEPVDGATRVTIIAEAHPGGLFKLAGPLFERLRRQQFLADLARVKEQIEAQTLPLP